MFCTLNSPALGKTSQRLALFGRDELRVEGEHFETPRDDVFDRAAGSVIARAELKVLKIVARFVESPLVMDGFGGQKRPAKVLFHDVTVFKNIRLNGPGGACRDAQHDVTALDTSSDLRKSVLLPIDLAHPFVLALTRAKSLFAVDVARATPPRTDEHGAAVLARDGVSDIGFCPLNYSEALDGTVFRVSTIFSPVFGKVSRFVREWRTALLASKCGGFGAFVSRRWTAVNGLVGADACLGAEAAIQFPLSRYYEQRSALGARPFFVSGFTFRLLTCLAAKTLKRFSGTDREGIAAKLAVFRDWHWSGPLHRLHFGDYPNGMPTSSTIGA